MSTLPVNTYWLIAEDLVTGAIGPFASPHQALSHFDWMKQQGAGAAFISILHDSKFVTEQYDLILTPEENKVF